jgi:hypothetical protein
MRRSIHTRGRLCKDCHSALAGGYDVHSVHREEVNCKICHASPRGWNSSIATIPVPEKTILYDGEYITIPGGSDCPYCHKSTESPKSLHDAHQPMLEETCPGCHGEVKEGTLVLWGWEIPPKKEERRGIIDLIEGGFSNLLNRSPVDASCEPCHTEVTRLFYSHPETERLAMIHSWAGNADAYIGPEGEIVYKKDFTTDENSKACLLCHPIEGVSRYTGKHEISFRPCTDGKCHGDYSRRGTKTFVDAGYAGLNLSAMGEAHSKGFISMEIQFLRGWRMCTYCHKVHLP